MDVPNPVICDNGVQEPAHIALAMLLRRLAYPSRLSDIYQAFGWEPSRVSHITRVLANNLYNRWRFLLQFAPSRLTPERLAYFACTIHLKGAPLKECWGFIDGTFESVARPVRNQRMLHNGWKRDHGIKFQAVVSPDGIRAHIYGPVEGRRHGETLYKESGLAGLLEKFSHAPDGSPLVIYGDPAYGLSTHLISPFKGLNLSPAEKEFNRQMSKVREAVEWSFAEVGNLFRFLDYGKNLKVLLQPIGTLHLVAFLLCNAHTILHGSQISAYFNCPPPTLEEYFHGAADEALEFVAAMEASRVAMHTEDTEPPADTPIVSDNIVTAVEAKDLQSEDVFEETDSLMDIVTVYDTGGVIRL